MESTPKNRGRFINGISYSPSTQFKKGEHWRQHSVFRDRDYLITEYQVKNRSANELAAEHGVTPCAITFWLRKHDIKRRTTSEVRAVKYWAVEGDKNPMFGRTGSNNPNYKDGSTPERQTMCARSFWKMIVRTVFRRDDFVCKRCSCKHSTKNPLHAHHLVPWSVDESLRFEIDNLLTLCKKCHNWVHSKRNIDQQFIYDKLPAK